MASSKFILYGRQNAGSFAPQVLLEEVGAPYERVWVGRDPESAAKYRQVAPTGKVPALTLPDGTVLLESAAICIHLADTHPQAKLAPPAGSTAHARFLQWMLFLATSVYEDALRLYYPARYSAGGEAHAEGVKQQGTADFLKHVELVSHGLAPYVLGSAYSAADPYLYMLASWYPGELAELHARMPKLAAHARLMRERPSLRKVEADHAG